MAGDSGKETDSLTWLQRLQHDPQEFDFHQALRRLECLFVDKPRFGRSIRPAQEPIRLGQDPSMAFAPSAITAFKMPLDDVPGRLAVAFFGMFGPHGPLPTHITEYARDRLRNSADRTLASFIDLFNHRMLLLFHRAWATAQPVVCQDRPESSRFAIYVGAIFGLALDAVKERDVIPDRAKLQYAGRLAAPTRNAEGIRAMVAHYFGVPAQVEQFIGEWVDIPESGRWRLGYSREVSAMAETTVVGARAWQCNHKFRIVLGPLSRDELQRFLPGAPNLERLTALVRSYVGRELAWDVRLTLAPDASDQLQLARGGRMGWNTRLGRSHSGATNEDLIVDPSLGQTQRVASRVAA
jgi:type VI secretion system protein ImpH